MSNEFEDKIKKWLSGHGYPLEMRTARKFREALWDGGGTYDKHRWEAEQSVIYQGKDKLRETDVVATLRAGFPGSKPWRAFEFVVIVECKSNQSKPWVVFSSEATAGPSLFGIESRAANGIGSQLLGEIGRASVFDNKYDFFEVRERAGYGAVCAFEEGNQDQAYGTILSVTEAAQHWCQFSGNEHTLRCRLVFPLVVIAAPIVECYLDANNSVQITAKEHMTLFRVSAAPGRDYHIVDIVTETGLPDYIARLTNLHRLLWENEQSEIVKALDIYQASLDADL